MLNRKLNMQLAEEIRHRYRSGGISQRKLADEFGVPPSTICHIVNGKSYTVPEEGYERTCEHCGLRFRAKFALAIWCGDRCYTRNKAGLPRPVCRRCGVDVSTSPVGKLVKYCSSECRKQGRLSPDGDGKCAVCDRPMMIIQAGQLYCGIRCNLWSGLNPGKKRRIAAECLVCSGPIVGRRDHAIYCSETCSSAVSRERRRARFRNVPYENINRTFVGERDNWLCGICHGWVDQSLVWPDPMCMSIDHIMPISRGGPHLYENIQLAHLRCNLSKAAKVAA